MIYVPAVLMCEACGRVAESQAHVMRPGQSTKSIYGLAPPGTDSDLVLQRVLAASASLDVVLPSGWSYATERRGEYLVCSSECFDTFCLELERRAKVDEARHRLGDGRS